MKQPSQQTIKRLFAISGNVCAFPNCITPLVYEGTGKVTGRICHIKGRSPGGPRYDPEQTEDERHDFDNLLLLCSIHHDIIDSDPLSYTVELLRDMKMTHEKKHGVSSILSDEIANKLLATSNVTDGSIITSINQSGSQTAHSITNIGNNVERQIILNKPVDDRLMVDTFCIDSSRCAYKEHRFDTAKPLWPDDVNPITVCYLPGGKIETYGQTFSSWRKAEKYGDQLQKRYNHYSFYEGAPHTIYLERLDKSPKKNKPNYPVFYVAVSNHSGKHAVMSTIEARVHAVTPLAAIGESHALVPLNLYRLHLEPSEGRYITPAVPSLKIEAGDAAAFQVLLEPNVQMLGGYHWFMTLHFMFGEQLLPSDTIAIVM